MIERESREKLPEALGEMSPGPRLAAALESIDRAGLSGFDLVVLLRARGRQLAFEQAELAADMVAVAQRVRDESSKLTWVWNSDVDGLAAAEIGAALTWTKRAARAGLQDAWALVERLPGVWATLRSGSIDLPRAKTLVEGTAAVGERLARQVVTQLLPEAPDLTTGQLAYRLRRLIAEADPAAARKSYEDGIAQRKVVRGLNADGTGYLSGCNLPTDQAAVADERLDALARAAKQAGDDRPMDQIRADIFLALIGGTYSGPGPINRRGVIELTADLPTLMGLADRAGELAGWGAVIADIARQIARARAGDSETIWRYSITDPFTGRLLHHGTTQPPAPSELSPRDPRRRPSARQRAFVIARDRTCRGPGCRVPARRTELDHRLDHAKGGPTEVWNLDAKCGHCHDLKDGGWSAGYNAFDDTTWTSLLGHTYRVPAEPITPPSRLGVLEGHLLHNIRMRT